MGLEVREGEISQAPRGKQGLNRSPCFSTQSYSAETPPPGSPCGSSLPIPQMGRTEVLSSPAKKQGKGPQTVCPLLWKCEPCSPPQMLFGSPLFLVAGFCVSEPLTGARVSVHGVGVKEWGSGELAAVGTREVPQPKPGP